MLCFLCSLFYPSSAVVTPKYWSLYSFILLVCVWIVGISKSFQLLKTWAFWNLCLRTVCHGIQYLKTPIICVCLLHLMILVHIDGMVLKHRYNWLSAEYPGFSSEQRQEFFLFVTISGGSFAGGKQLYR